MAHPRLLLPLLAESNLDAVRDEIDQERKRSLGAEEYARRKYDEYERNLEEERRKTEQYRQVEIDYNSKNFEAEQQVRDLLRQLETEKQMRQRAIQEAERKTQELDH